MKSAVPDDPLSRFSLSIFALNGLLMQSGDDVTRPLGQTSAKWQVLGRAGYMPQTVSQMAREMGSSRQSVQYTADALARAGLVAYVENPADKRANLITLTPRGGKILASIYAKDREMSQRLMAKLNPQQLLEISSALNDIAKVFENFLNEKENGGT